MGFGGMVETKEKDYVVGPRCCEHKNIVWGVQGVMQQKINEMGCIILVGGVGPTLFGKTMGFPNNDTW
jgi:hypothetical protein